MNELMKEGMKNIPSRLDRNASCSDTVWIKKGNRDAICSLPLINRLESVDLSLRVSTSE
jgi:hypothetical protein